MIIDCFPFFNEKEILEARVNTLKDHVDAFFVVEANRTHKGDLKPFKCAEYLRELGLPEDKIQLIHVELPSAEEVPDPWIRERAQRDALAIPMRDAPSGVHFFVSDCDEIPNPEKLKEAVELAKEFPDRYVSLSMRMFFGRANLEAYAPNGVPFEWKCGMIVSSDQIRDTTLSQIRARGDYMYYGNRDAGWHLTWMGDAEKRKIKANSIAEHYLFDNDEIREYLKTYEPEHNSHDPLNRPDHVLKECSMNDLPPALFATDASKLFFFGTTSAYQYVC